MGLDTGGMPKPSEGNRHKETMPQVNNLFAGIPEALPEEVFQELLKTPHFRLERIVSHGQASPPGFWYDEPTHEWVAMLPGRAALKFADRTDLEVLKPGDHLLIPAGCRHRVSGPTPRERQSGWPCTIDEALITRHLGRELCKPEV